MKMKKFIAIMTVTAMIATMATGCGRSKSRLQDNATESDTESRTA